MNWTLMASAFGIAAVTGLITRFIVNRMAAGWRRDR
jgi:hypothetical protein